VESSRVSLPPPVAIPFFPGRPIFPSFSLLIAGWDDLPFFFPGSRSQVFHFTGLAFFFFLSATAGSPFLPWRRLRSPFFPSWDEQFLFLPVDGSDFPLFFYLNENGMSVSLFEGGRNGLFFFFSSLPNSGNDGGFSLQKARSILFRVGAPFPPPRSFPPFFGSVFISAKRKFFLFSPRGSRRRCKRHCPRPPLTVATTELGHDSRQHLGFFPPLP